MAWRKYPGSGKQWGNALLTLSIGPDGLLVSGTLVGLSACGGGGSGSSSSGILLLQLINPLESVEFSKYETQAEAVWDQFGARQRFASRIFARMSGDRTFLEARVIEFPNISMLIDAFFSEPFAQAMASLCLAASDQAWIAGVEQVLPKLQDANSGPVMLLPDPLVLTEESAKWEEVPIVRYASRDAFLNIFVLDPSTGDDIIHKWAGIENTQVLASEQRHDTPPEPVNGYLYNYRYCEILLPIITDGNVTAEVWGTQGVNNCPQQAWDAIAPRDIAEQFGAPTAIKNGVRFFVVDWVSGGDLRGGERRFYGDLGMALLTTVVAPQATNQGNAAYNIARVARDNVWHFVSGRSIYELIDPDGYRFVMQSCSQSIDSELSLEDLDIFRPGNPYSRVYFFRHLRRCWTIFNTGVEGSSQIARRWSPW